MNADDFDAANITRAADSAAPNGLIAPGARSDEAHPHRGPPQRPLGPAGGDRGPLGRQAAAAITVMIASTRRALLSTWMPRLMHMPGIDLHAEPLTDPVRLRASLGQRLPAVLLLDKPLLDMLDAPSLRALSGFGERTRVILLGDEACHGLLSDVVRYRFRGLLPTTCLPEVGLRAIRAVSRGELWLSRATMANVIAGLLPAASAADPDPPPAAAGRDDLRALTPREQQIVELLRRGRSNKEIGLELGVMEDTVKKHLQGVFGKLGVHRRALVALRPQGVEARHA